MSSPPQISSIQTSQIADPRDRLIIALDFRDVAQVVSLVSSLGDSAKWYKIGLELYLAGGYNLVQDLVGQGHSVFLDLKFHDIPNTVAGAVRSAAASGASLLTIHAAGGPDMVAAAVEAARSVAGAPRILAVTVLTSMDQQQLSATGVNNPLAEQVHVLASLALAAGADGLVCSAQEALALRTSFGPAPTLVTPGIRPEGTVVGDQKRVTTPASAIRAGATYLVVGRPITQAANPLQAAQDILAEIAAAT